MAREPTEPQPPHPPAPPGTAEPPDERDADEQEDGLPEPLDPAVKG